MSATYSKGVDISMIFISAMLVVSSSMGMKLYDSAATFKHDADGKPKSSGLTLGLKPDGVNMMNMFLTVLGSVSVGIFGLSVAYKQTNVAHAKAPTVTVAVFGFAVALALLLSGVSTLGLYDTVETFKADAADTSPAAARRRRLARSNVAQARARKAAAVRRGAPVAREDAGVTAEADALASPYKTKAHAIGGVAIGLGALVMVLISLKVAKENAPPRFSRNSVNRVFPQSAISGGGFGGGFGRARGAFSGGAAALAVGDQSKISSFFKY